MHSNEKYNYVLRGCLLPQHNRLAIGAKHRHVSSSLCFSLSAPSASLFSNCDNMALKMRPDWTVTCTYQMVVFQESSFNVEEKC